MEIQEDINRAGKRAHELLDLAIRYFSEEVGLEFSQLSHTERDVYLHLKDHVFTLAKAGRREVDPTDKSLPVGPGSEVGDHDRQGLEGDHA